MFESLRFLAGEIQAGMLDIRGLKRIILNPPCSAEALKTLQEKLPNWPEVLTDLLVCFDGVKFLPDRGCLLSVANIVSLYSQFEDLGRDNIAAKIALFGIDGSGKILALSLISGKLPGQEPVIAFKREYLQNDGYLAGELTPEDPRLDRLQIGLGFSTWLDSWVDRLRAEAQHSHLADFPMGLTP